MEGTAALVERLALRLRAEVLETHISWVLLAGPLAYKVKKPLRLPFLDYATLERRRRFCVQEVRLNRRFAPGLYLGVSRITGPAQDPAIDGAGPVLEYAVRMRRFPAGALFSEQLAAGTLAAASVDRLAQRLAAWQAAAPVAQGPAHDAQQRRQRTLAALDAAAPLLSAREVGEMRRWVDEQCTLLQDLWPARRAHGRVRECHGDLHLANILDLDGDVAAFDCIEFDPALRWIDVIDDTAFPLMDFAARGRPDLGWRFFDDWLERTGDHDALPALRLCVAYRALVRAQAEHRRRAGSSAARDYARTALAWCRGARAQLLITHGLPGSGKTFASQALLERLGAIRLRSDVERKRLFGLGPLDDSRAAGLDLYTPEATRLTYERLFSLARGALQSGLPVILDAAFLRHEERVQARSLARKLDVPFSIVACEAPLPVLQERLRARRHDASEADIAVLEKLRAAAEPLQPAELACLASPASLPA